MESLFGIPMDRLLAVLLALFTLGALATTVLVLRNPVLFKLAVRNIPRRRAQTILIVLGLMLATLLFSASLTTGDTLTHSIRVQAIERLGAVDLVVQAEQREAGGRRPYFSGDIFARVRERIAEQPYVAGVAPVVREEVPVVAPEARLSAPRVDLLGLEDRWMSGFDRLETRRGAVLTLDALEPGEVYLSEALQEEVGVAAGDAVQVYFGPGPVALTVAGVYTQGAGAAREMSLVAPLSWLQEVVERPGQINGVYVAGEGGPVSSARHSDAVAAALEPLLEGTGLVAEPVKQQALERADEQGSTFASVFLLFGQFSIAAGVLLIFLIFVMLAAERKQELGIARAVGAQRGHVVRLFTYEGTVYALMAAAVGSLLGIGVGWGMVRIITVALGAFDLQLTFSFSWRSLVIAYTLGMVFTFLIVLISSWRVSRLNIVRAVRDIPEPEVRRRSLKGVVGMVLLVALGVFLTLFGLQGEQTGPFMGGVSLVVIGVALLAHRLGIPERAAFTTGALVLLTWWLLPADVTERFLPQMQTGIEMFFLTGIMLVIGAVWAVIYNADLLLRGAVLVLGRLHGSGSVVKMAIAYPMHARFRTGMTLAMVSLVVFTLVVMAVVIQSLSAVFSDPLRLTGGFHLRTSTSYANPIPDLGAALEHVDGLDSRDIAAIGGFSAARVTVVQEGFEDEPEDLVIRGADAGYVQAVTYRLDMRASGYESDRAVWQALAEEPGTAVVAGWMVPTKVNYDVGGPERPFQLQGFWREDGALPEVYVRAREPRTGREQRLRVIGVLSSDAFYAGGLLTSQETVDSLYPRPLPPQIHMLRLSDGVDAEATAKAIRAAFLEHGMEAEVLEEEIRRNTTANRMLNNLLQGFMGLGLVVGIAALGVIAARSVVERRQQIGVLRALGFQRGMVQLAFLLESSFVALLGIGIGIALGFGVAPQIIDSFSQDFQGVSFRLPWLNVALIAAIAYLASVLTTYLPARQAANTYPAEALRYE